MAKAKKPFMGFLLSLIISAVILTSVGVDFLAFPIGLITLFIITFGIAGVITLAFKIPSIPLARTAPQVRNAAIVSIVVALAFTFGFLGTFGFATPFDLGTAAITGAAIGQPAGAITLGTCAAQVGNTAILGKSTTVTIRVLDAENNDPQTELTNFLARAYVDTDNGQVLRATIDGGSEQTFTAKVGQTGRIVGGNSTAYIDETTFCVTGEIETVEVTGHTVEARADLTVTCFDVDGNVLSGGTNTTEEDYDITMSTNEETAFSCKIKVATANAAFQVGAIVTAGHNEVDRVTVNALKNTVCQTGHDSCKSPTLTFQAVPLPQHLDDVGVQGSAAGSGNLTGYDKAWIIGAVGSGKPILLQEFDEVQYEFTIESGTVEPATGTTYALSDMGIICFLDSVWDRADSGIEVLSFFTQDTNEDNVGMVEDIDIPVGRDACVVIEAI